MQRITEMRYLSKDRSEVISYCNQPRSSENSIAFPVVDVTSLGDN